MSNKQEPTNADESAEPLTDAELDAVSGGLIIAGGRTAGQTKFAEVQWKHHNLGVASPATYGGIIIEGVRAK